MTASSPSGTDTDTDDEVVDAETALSSITLTADEIVALREFHPDMFPPGIGMDDESFSARAGLNSLLVRGLLVGTGALAAPLEMLAALYALADRRLLVADSSVDVGRQRTLHVGPDAGVVHVGNIEHLHLFATTLPSMWDDDLADFVLDDVDAQPDGVESTARAVEDLGETIDRVIHVTGIRRTGGGHESVEFSILCTDAPWMFDAETATVRPLTTEALRSQLAPLSNGTSAPASSAVRTPNHSDTE